MKKSIMLMLVLSTFLSLVFAESIVFNDTVYGYDSGPIIASITTADLPDGAVITNTQITLTFGNSSYAGSWYDADLSINGTDYPEVGWLDQAIYNDLNGLGPNGLEVSATSVDSDSWGDNITLSLTVEVFYTPPAGTPEPASNPGPAHNASNVALNGNLTWDFGADTDTYDLWFGPSGAMIQLAFGALAGSSGFYPYVNLSSSTQYSWRVDAINTDSGIKTTGTEWSFRTVLPEGMVQIGFGAQDFDLPLNAFYGYNYSQMLYLQTEIETSNKRIEKLYFQWNGYQAGTNYKDWTIFLGHTDKAEFSSSTDWVPITELSQVFNGEVSIPATPGWIEIVLSTPFIYNNTDNLVIAVNETTPSYGSSSAYFFGTSTDVYRGLRLQNDSSAYNPASVGSGSLVSGIANVRMLFGDLPLTPEFSYSPESLSFVNTVSGTNSEWQNVTVSNNGQGILNLTEADLQIIGTDTACFEFDNQFLPAALEATESVIIPVRFIAPVPGDYSAALRITYDSVDYDVALSGSSVNPFVNMSNGSKTLVVGESWGFFDSGGASGDYVSNESFSYTFNPPDGYRTTVTFSAFNTEPNYDYLKVYDGENAEGTLIGNYSGTSIPPDYTSIITGSITFVFTSDGSSNRSGWEAIVSSEELPTEPIFDIDPATFDYGVVNLGDSSVQNFTITNTGVGDLFINRSDITISGEHAEEFFLSIPDADISLAAYESAEITVTFNPTNAGPKNAILNIVDNIAAAKVGMKSSSKSIHQVALSGECYDPSVSSFPYTEDFSIWPATDWTQLTGLYPLAAAGVTQWVQDEWLNVSSSSNKAAKINIYGSSRNGWLVTPPINIPAMAYQLKFDAALMGWNSSSAPATTQEDDRFMVLMSDSRDMSDPVILREWNNTGSEWVFNEIPAEGASYTLTIPGAAGTKYFAFYGESTVGSNGDNDFMIDNVTIVGPDYPAGEPITIGEGEDELTITISGGSANNVPDGLIPPVNNGLFVASDSFVIQLIGAGPWTITIQSNAPWIAYYQGGAWHAHEPVGGIFSFVIEAAKDLDLPIILGDLDPTLPVELSSFTAVLTADLQVNIAWIVETETDHSGYNVLRNETDVLASALRINSNLLDEGSLNGTQISYQFLDDEVLRGATYYYWLESVALNGESEHFGPLKVTIKADGEDPIPEIPLETKLFSAFPNPFNPNTNLRYSMKEAGEARIDIFNVKGQLLKTFKQNHEQAGYYQVSWDGRDVNGHQVSTGVYFYRMSSGKYSHTKKMVLSK